MNAKDNFQYTPLHEAATKSKVEVCSLLIRCGANPLIKDCYGKTAIDATTNEKLKARMGYEYRGYTFLNYICNGEYSKLKKYLSSSATNSNSNTANSSDSPMFSSPASPLSHISYINSAHSCLADKSSASACNSYSNNGNCSSSHTQPPTSDLIYFKNSVNGNGPLHYVVNAHPSVSIAKRRQIAEFLIKKNALVNETNHEGLTPLALALEHDQIELAECFLKNGARIDIIDGRGLSVLHRMAQKGNYPAVQVGVFETDIPMSTHLSIGMF